MVKKIILLFLTTVITIQGAPARTDSLLSIVESDKRTENLRSHRFVKGECSNSGNNFSSLICVSLFDVAIRLDDKHLEFNRNNVTFENSDTFCDALMQLLPDSPSNDTTKAFKEYNRWFKDELRKNASLCKDSCFYEDAISYIIKLKPVCQFVYNQYKLLTPTEQQVSNKKQVAELQNIETETTNVETDKEFNDVISEAGPGPEQIIAIAVPAKDIQTALNATSLEQNQIQNVPVVANDTNAYVQQQQEKLNDTSASANLTEKKVIISSTPGAKLSTVTVTAATAKKEETPIKSNEAKKDQQQISLQDEEENNQLENDNEIYPVSEKSAKENPLEEEDDAEDQGPQFEGDDDGDYNMDKKDNNFANDMQNGALPEAPGEDEEVHHKKIVMDNFEEEPDSNFFTYLCILMFLCITLYIMFHNKQKLMALLLEGRRGSRRTRERSRGGSKAAYSKLDCNLEEAITSKKNMSGKSMDIIY